MNFPKHLWSNSRRLTPFAISLLFHITLLTFFAFTTWNIPSLNNVEEAVVATIATKKPQEDQLGFQDTSF